MAGISVGDAAGSCADSACGRDAVERGLATGAAPESAPLLRRFAAVFYEGLLLAAVLWLAALPLTVAEQALALPHVRIVLQAYLVLVSAVYFGWQWMRGGQTLPMKTWRLRLVTTTGARLGMRHAIVRYVAALLGLAALGFGFAWALIDRDRLFLHDRIAGTRVVRA